MKKILFYLVCVSIGIESQLDAAKRLAEEVIQKKFKFDAPLRNCQLVVDNLNGAISVRGHANDEVQLNVHKKVRAKSDEKLNLAQQQVRLDITTSPQKINLYVDGPFRGRNGQINNRGYHYYGYEVHYDFEIVVPNDIEIILETINDGEINIERFSGQFDVNNINGGVEMSQISGAGRVYALNGDVLIEFAKNPVDDCYVGSLNGRIEARFEAPFSAELAFKTFNGEVYSDFPVEYSRQKLETETLNKGKKIYKSKRKFRVRAGDGGPELFFDAFNGDIHLLKK